jgi:hypothetical protein
VVVVSGMAGHVSHTVAPHRTLLRWDIPCGFFCLLSLDAPVSDAPDAQTNGIHAQQSGTCG